MNKYEQFALISSMTDDERAYILTFGLGSKILFTIGSILSWICSTVAKYIMYRHLEKMKTDRRPITVLIIMAQIVDYFVQTFVIINYFMILSSGAGAVDFLNTFFNLRVSAYTYCWIYCYVTFFWIGYASYSDFGMALLRYFKLQFYCD
jgi:hypothetical protein